MKKIDFSKLENEVSSSFDHLNEDSLAMIAGGAVYAIAMAAGNSGQSFSNAGCDNTAVCCTPPPIKK